MNVSNSANQFSVDRFQLVLKRQMVLNRRTWVVGFLSAAGFLLLIAVLPFILGIGLTSQSGFTSIQDTALFFYLVGGLILTSTIFNEIHVPSRSFQFLTLPSTTLEKLSAAWATGAIIYTIAAMAAIFVLSILTEVIEGINTGYWGGMDIFKPLSKEVLGSVLTYFFYQSFFLLGAVYFRKNHFLKTLLVFIAVFLGFFIFFNTAILIFGLTQDQEFLINIQLDAVEWFVYVKYTLGTGLTLLFIWLSYLQLKNKQVA